jgi:hypothetical protein
LVIGIVLAVARPVVAGHVTIVVMSDPGRVGELNSALQVALSGRNVAIATAPLPAGALRLDRAAAAQRVALELGAEVALWIDRAPDAIELCAVSSDGRYFRHTPMPPEDSPRAFAAIATSLVDELFAPPEAGFDVDMHVHVDSNGAPPAMAVDATRRGDAGAGAAIGGAALAPGAIAPRALAPSPGSMGGGVVASDSVTPVRADRTLLEIGPMLSPMTAGLEAELAFPITPTFRLGVVGGANVLLWDDTHQAVYLAGLELRRVSPGQRHLDFGLIGGVAWVAHDDAAPYAALRIGFTWEHAGSGTQLSVAPVIAKVYSDYVPGAYVSLRWELPI